MPAPGTTRVALVVALCAHAGTATGGELRDLYFGEALYYANQERYFDALQRLDGEIAQHYRVDEPQLDSLHYHIRHAEFSVGDFELRYRMHHRAGRAIRAVLEADVEESVRNDAAFRLARLHFQKGQPDDALQALERIQGSVPEAIRDDVEFLRANVYLALARPSDAVEVLDRIQDSEPLKGFTAYNLGIALLQEGRTQQGLEQLNLAGEIEGGDGATQAIRDKSNLVLGTLLFESSAFEPAERSLQRVRLDGPFSNQALLRAGWADASAQNFQRAVVAWGILAERESTDAAVQEAQLALPFAFGKLNLHGRAAVLYGRAMESYGVELAKLDASLRSIREGEFLRALVRDEIRQDKDWLIRLREQPAAPETFYLTTLMASHEFQTALQNYLDLEDMRRRAASWQRNLDSFEDLIRLRREYYEPLLPEIDARFRRLDSQMRLRLEQRDHIDQRLQNLLIAPRPDYLATAEEQRVAAALERLEAALASAAAADRPALDVRLRRLKGALLWNLETQYHERLTAAHQHLRALNRDVAVLTKQYDAFVRTRQAAKHSYTGYEPVIGALRERIGDALERLEAALTRQGELLEMVASNELELRRERLAAQLNQARFAFADSYDRAAKAQVR